MPEQVCMVYLSKPLDLTLNGHGTEVLCVGFCRPRRGNGQTMTAGARGTARG